MINKMKKGYNTRYDDPCELKCVWIDMFDMVKFIVNNLDSKYFTIERIEELKIILTEIEETKLSSFILESEFDEVF